VVAKTDSCCLGAERYSGVEISGGGLGLGGNVEHGGLTAHIVESLLLHLQFNSE